MINLVYFGTSNHSITLLNSLKSSPEISLKLVITKPDKPVGRKQEVLPCPVKTWCLQNSVAFVTPANLKTEAESVLKALTEAKSKSADGEFLAVVADYGLMIPKPILDFFEKGVVNVHFSLLPKYRGASPVTYSILNGDTQTGISFLLTEEGMDTGKLIKQIAFEITEKENDETLYTKLFNLAAANLVEVLKAYLNGDLPPQKQDEKVASYATPSGKLDRTTYILKDDAKIDWSKTPEQIERAIRAYYPWPVAWTTLGELALYLNAELRSPHPQERVKIHKAHLREGVLIIDQLQVEGKTSSTFETFKNGYLR